MYMYDSSPSTLASHRVIDKLLWGYRQIGRHGISGEKSSVLARAAFEITVPNIVAAAMRGESDPLKGVTENVIVGQSIPIGTGLVDLYMSTTGREKTK